MPGKTCVETTIFCSHRKYMLSLILLLLHQVSVLLIVLMFVFATFGVHLLGGRLARCNDPAIKDKVSLYQLKMESEFSNSIVDFYILMFWCLKWRKNPVLARNSENNNNIQNTKSTLTEVQWMEMILQFVYSFLFFMQFVNSLPSG